ncbi:MAG: glycosyltransferase family 4 protein [Chthoniobacteraceae bacterium]
MPPPTLALCLEYPLAMRGGVSVLVETLIAGLADEFRIVLVSPDDARDLAEHPVASLVARHLDWNPGEVSTATSRALVERLVAEGCDLAHFHLGGVFGWGIRFPGQSPFGFAAKAGIAVCSTVHLTVSLLDGFCGPQKPLWFKLALLPVAWLGKLGALRHARAEIAVSRFDEARLRRWYAPLAGRFRQIYHSRLSLGTESPTAARSTTILNVGHLAHRKGQHVLVDAFARIATRHPQWQLQLVGPHDDAASVERVRAMIERAGLRARVQLSGSRDDAIELMRTAGIYVQPSLEEALGRALQEALFEGCPAIGSDAGGIPELIADGDNGLLVPKGDAGALADALDRLITDAELRARLGARARPSIVERGMLADAMVARHRELYREILASR